MYRPIYFDGWKPYQPIEKDYLNIFGGCLHEGKFFLTRLKSFFDGTQAYLPEHYEFKTPTELAQYVNNEDSFGRLIIADCPTDALKNAILSQRVHDYKNKKEKADPYMTKFVTLEGPPQEAINMVSLKAEQCFNFQNLSGVMIGVPETLHSHVVKVSFETDEQGRVKPDFYSSQLGGVFKSMLSCLVPFPLDHKVLYENRVSLSVEEISPRGFLERQEFLKFAPSLELPGVRSTPLRW